MKFDLELHLASHVVAAGFYSRKRAAAIATLPAEDSHGNDKIKSHAASGRLDARSRLTAQLRYAKYMVHTYPLTAFTWQPAGNAEKHKPIHVHVYIMDPE